MHDDTAREAEIADALAACAAGDRAALRRLYDLEARNLLGVALRIVRERQPAEDVLHDAFVSVWTKAGSYDRSRGSARGWLYSVVRNRALTHVRDRAWETPVEDETLEALGAEREATAPDVAEAFELKAAIGPLRDCLAQLAPVKRMSIMLAYVDGLSHSEIAERLAAPPGSVKTWIRRGLQSLRECLG